MANNSSNANYGGRQPNTSTYVKSFNYGHYANTWSYSSNYTGYEVANNTLLLTPVNSAATVYIEGDLVVNGSITNPSDKHLKKNIQPISLDSCNKIMNLQPVTFNYIDDVKEKLHFGMIALEVEEELPNLVSTLSTVFEKTTLSIKTVNYLELIPILLTKVKDLQSQIDVLNSRISDK